MPFRNESSFNIMKEDNCSEPDEEAIKSLKDIVGEEIDEMFNIGMIRIRLLN